MREAGNQTEPNRIANIVHDDRNPAGRVLGGNRRRRRPGDNDVHVEPYHLGGEAGQSIKIPVGGTILDGDVLVIDIAEVFQPAERR